MFNGLPLCVGAQSGGVQDQVVKLEGCSPLPASESEMASIGLRTF